MFGYLLIIVTLGLMWLLLIRPQQRRVREHDALVASLEVGQEIVTGAGIYGTITALEGDRAEILVAPGVRIWIAAGAVGALAEPPLEDATDDEPVAAIDLDADADADADADLDAGADADHEVDR